MLCAPLRSHSARPAIASASASLTCYFTRVFAVRDLNQELTNYLGKKRGLGRRNNLQRSKAPIYPHRNLPAQSVPMAFILPGLRRSLLISAPLLISTPLLVQAYRRPVLCDGPDPLTKLTSDLRNNYSNEAQTPIIQTSGAPNPRAIRQISLGSILGLMAGLGVSVFSKPLALLIGLGVVCIQVRLQSMNS